MHLNKLELIGFKSFADKAAFEFEGALTALVGPNGSGKSNVVDALKWVLGEQNARRLRGTEMTDMIFNGSPSRKPAGCAEVRLTLENDRGLLPVEYGEICISRRLYRSGESEYLLNGSPCRLKDIRSLLLDTGAGVSAYSVMEQGQVDMLLRASPKERRTVFEEAAGINRYLIQKKEAERKLERVRANLERVRDIIEELQRQLRSVRYQAAKARRFKRQTDELRRLRLALALHAYRGLVRGRSENAQAIALQEEARRHLAEQAAALKTHLAAQQRDLEKLRDELAQAEERLSHVNARHYSLGRETELNQKRRAELEAQSDQLQRRCAEMRSRLAATHRELAESEVNLQQISRSLEARRQAYQDCGEALKSLAGQRAELEQTVEREKSAIFDLMQQGSQLQNQAAMLSAERETLVNRLKRQRELAAQLQDQCHRARTEHAAAERRLGGLKSELKHVKQHLTGIESRMSESSVALERVTSQIGELKAETLGKVSRKQFLEDLQARAEGVGGGVKLLLGAIADGASPLAGSPGLLAQLLEVPKGYALAVEAALGSHVQAVVVRTTEQAREALRLLREGRKGRAEVIPLDALSAPGGGEFDGVEMPARRLIEVVRHPAEAAPAVRALLGDCFVVPDSSAATALLARGLPGRAKIVTRAGECFEPGGVWSAGEPETGSLISRKSELLDLQRQIEDLRARLEPLSAEGGRWSEQIEQLRRERSACQAKRDELAGEESDARSQLSMLISRQEQRTEELQFVRAEADSLEEDIQQAEQRTARVQQEIETLVRRRDERQARLPELQGKLQQQSEAQETLTSRRHALGSELARLEEQHNGLSTLAGRLREDLQRQSEEGDRIAAEHRQNALQQQEAAERIEEARRQRQQLEQEKAQLDRRMEEKSNSCRTAREQIAALQDEQDRLTAQREQADHALHELRVAENENRLKLEGLMDRTKEECGVHLPSLQLAPEQWRECPLFVEMQIEEFAADQQDDAASAQTADWYVQARENGPQDQDGQEEDGAPARVKLSEATELQQGVLAVADAPDTDWQALHEQAQKLKKQLERMGGANLDAIREQEELEIRAQFLTNQSEDLEKARRHELEIIRELSKKSRERFLETFNAVRDNFQRVLRKIFGGGTGDLILDPEEPDVLEAGIDVLVRPPGKPSGPLSLLSGGEKAMAAVALLFAIFEAKPSPFCLLDEVDAALDESNLQRFVALLQQYAQNTQFVIVTHNKVTMSMAETLHGVSLQEDGASRKIAVNFEEVDRRLVEMDRETRSAQRQAKAG